MKLFSLRLTTLKSKLYAIVFASFVVRVVAFFALPDSSTSLTSDEVGYAELTEVVAKELPTDESPYGRLHLISRTLILPASLLNRLGTESLDSVRIIASAYGLLASVLIAYLYLQFMSLQQNNKDSGISQKSVASLFAIFCFLPSHLAWSILGIRESAMEFWVLAVFVTLFYIFEVRKSLSKSSAIGIVLAIVLVFSSRPQVGWVLGITLLTYFLVKIKVRASQILIPITLIGIVSGYVATTAFSIERTQVFEANVEVISSTPPAIATSTSSPTKKATPKPSKSEQVTSSPTATSQAEFNASVDCKTEGQEVIVQGVKYLCEKKVEKKSIVGLENPVVVLIDQAEAIPQRQEGNKVGAASAIKTLACPITGESRLDKYFCIAYRAPYMTFTFLFRPMLGVDVTSDLSLFAGLENVFWLGAALFVLVMFIRNRRLAFFGALAPSLLFFSIYSVAAGSYEGNMGTAFRHKSLILWVVLLLLASTIVATQQRKAEQQGISGSSQE